MLDSILDKLGVKKVEDLTPEERKVYLQWKSILDRPDVTMDDLKKILPAELDRARTEMTDFKNGPKKDLYYKAYLRLLETLTDIIVTRGDERNRLRAELGKKFNLE